MSRFEDEGFIPTEDNIVEYEEFVPTKPIKEDFSKSTIKFPSTTDCIVSE